jgi:hypothetical protein
MARNVKLVAVYLLRLHSLFSVVDLQKNQADRTNNATIRH